MKRFFLCSAILTLFVAGCGKEYDDTLLKDRVDTLEEQVQSNTEAINELRSKLEDANTQGLTVTVTPVEGGNKLTFSDGTSITVMNGENGATGPQGPKGEDGQDAVVTIKDSADGTAYVITFNNKEYTVRKSHTFSLNLETVAISVVSGQSQEIPYTISNGDATVKVFISAVSGFSAKVDMANNKVIITAPTEVPEDGYVVVTAVKNSTGEEASQYMSFVKGHLEVTADAQTVEAAGGVVTLTVTSDCEYTVSIPEGCTWITQVESKAMATSYVYLSVAANETTQTRTAEVKLISSAGVRTVAIAQKGVRPDGIEITPDNIAEMLSSLTSMNPEDLYGQTLNFTAGEYTSLETVNLDFSSSESMFELNFRGEEGTVFKTGKAVLAVTNVKSTFDGITFDGCKQALAVKGGQVVIQNCTFKNNTAVESRGLDRGAAVFMSGEAKVDVKNCTFEGNKAYYGADIYMVDGTLVVDGCQFKDSEAGTSGACLAMSSKGNTSGLYNSDFTKSNATVKNSTFTGIKAATALTNADDSPSGVISCVHGQVNVENCTFDSIEGKSGTIVTLGSINSNTWPFFFGNAMLKMNDCVVKNSSVTRLGLIYINGDGWGDSPNRRNVAFVNNTSFINTTSSTGNYGTIAHSGGNAGIIMMNNCTIYGVTLPESNCNGYAINTDGYILVSNSTIVANTKDGFFRNGAGNGNMKLINSIAINTLEGATHSIYGPEANPCSTDGHCIYGPADDERTGSFTDQIKNATTATLAGYAWDETAGLVKWNGPEESFTKLNSSEFQALFTGFGPKTPVLYQEASAGEAFYNWLVSIDAVGKDARGTSRGNSWWPGAYQN